MSLFFSLQPVRTTAANRIAANVSVAFKCADSRYLASALEPDRAASRKCEAVRDAARYRLGDLDAVDAGRQYTAGEAGTFTRWKKAGRVHAFKSVVSSDANGRGGAGFDTGQHRIRHVEAGDLPAECGKRLADGRDRIIRKTVAQIGRCHAWSVGWGDASQSH